MKKIQFPEVRCIELNSHDVILTSGDQGGTYDPDASLAVLLGRAIISGK